jgi:hypothetical protein
MLQAKSKGKACTHTLPRATATPEPASLLREGSGATTCPRLRTLPLRQGGLQRCHVPRGSRPRLTIQKGSDAATHPSAPDPASPPRRAPALTRILRLRTTPASEMGSDANTWPTTCIEARIFPKHVHALPRHLQDMRADNVIMTCKQCRQTQQHCATVHNRVADRSRAGWAKAMTR